MGDYPTGGARVWASAPQPGQVQAPPSSSSRAPRSSPPGSPRSPSATTGWPPGDYLFRLDGTPARSSSCRSPCATTDNPGRIVIVNAVTTWQAYNRWGGYSLYHGAGRRRLDRPLPGGVVRPALPADDMRAPGDFLVYELPFVVLAERAGLTLGYATDVDLHADPHLLDGARAMVTLGHDEYWSQADARPRRRGARPAGSTWRSSAATRSTATSASKPTPLGPDRRRGRLQGLRARTRSPHRSRRGDHAVAQPPDPRPGERAAGQLLRVQPRRRPTWSPSTPATGCCRAS